MLINGREKVGIKKLKNPKTFIEYSQTIDIVHENIRDHNPTKERRVLIVFDDMLADIGSQNSIFGLFLYRNLILIYHENF